METKIDIRKDRIRVVSSYRTYEEWKLLLSLGPTQRYVSFLPYLWGMETSQHHTKNWRKKGSYRTYEEWKLLQNTTGLQLGGSSYRTYEEWKREAKTPIAMAPILSSYRTYEEWKPPSRLCIVHDLCGFLPYLWGMETLPPLIMNSPPLSSYRTYEEWKPS